MSRVRFDWTEDAQRLGERFDDFFDRLVHLTSGPRNSFRHSWRPAVDIFEVESGLVFVVELPGVDEASLNVTVDGGRLYIRGTRRPPQIEHCGPLQLEIEYGPFERVIALPSDVETDETTAQLRNGLLSVHVPRRLKNVTVEVQAGGKSTP
jgi:HSP20 family protein